MPVLVVVDLDLRAPLRHARGQPHIDGAGDAVRRRPQRKRKYKIDDLVDPRMATVSTIMKHVHMGTIDTVFSLLDGKYEFIEAKILESSDLVNKSIKDSNLPEEVRVGAIVRKNKVMMPKSNFIFEKDDIVIVLSKRENIKEVEDIFRITS